MYNVTITITMYMKMLSMTTLSPRWGDIYKRIIYNVDQDFP